MAGIVDRGLDPGDELLLGYCVSIGITEPSTPIRLFDLLRSMGGNVSLRTVPAELRHGNENNHLESYRFYFLTNL